jgi:hypothetical protein
LRVSRPPDVVPRDAEQPWDDAGSARSVAFGVVNDRHKHILRDIVRYRRRAGDVERETVDVGPAAAIQRGEGVAIAGGDPGDQIFVRRFFGRGHQVPSLTPASHIQFEAEKGSRLRPGRVVDTRREVCPHRLLAFTATFPRKRRDLAMGGWH